MKKQILSGLSAALSGMSSKKSATEMPDMEEESSEQGVIQEVISKLKDVIDTLNGYLDGGDDEMEMGA